MPAVLTLSKRPDDQRKAQEGEEDAIQLLFRAVFAV
jgi:hypothetical protein